MECTERDSDFEQPQENSVHNIVPKLPVRGPRKALVDVSNTPRRALGGKCKTDQSPAVSPALQAPGVCSPSFSQNVPVCLFAM